MTGETDNPGSSSPRGFKLVALLRVIAAICVFLVIALPFQDKGALKISVWIFESAFIPLWLFFPAGLFLTSGSNRLLVYSFAAFVIVVIPAVFLTSLIESRSGFHSALVLAYAVSVLVGLCVAIVDLERRIYWGVFGWFATILVPGLCLTFTL